MPHAWIYTWQQFDLSLFSLATKASMYRLSCKVSFMERAPPLSATKAPR